MVRGDIFRLNKTNMTNSAFWQFFEAQAAAPLGHRQTTFRSAFEFLDRLERPVFIVETGCVRKADHWSDGQSTILFDKFVAGLPGSVVHSVDLNPQATALCKTLVSPAVDVHTGDSVAFLHGLAKNPPGRFPHIDLLYLDSYDVDLAAPPPSALHHLKELLAISPLIGPQTLIMVDDAPQEVQYIPRGNSGAVFITDSKVSGKGKYVAEYAESIGAKRVFSEYQVAWTGF
jgi:hypothetical protein